MPHWGTIIYSVTGQEDTSHQVSKLNPLMRTLTPAFCEALGRTQRPDAPRREAAYHEASAGNHTWAESAMVRARVQSPRRRSSKKLARSAIGCRGPRARARASRYDPCTVAPRP